MCTPPKGSRLLEVARDGSGWLGRTRLGMARGGLGLLGIGRDAGGIDGRDGSGWLAFCGVVPRRGAWFPGGRGAWCVR
eukprot:1372647-Prymnesium_polylepis.1